MEEGIDKVVSLAKTYHRKVAPLIRPKLVEKSFVMDIPELPVPLKAVIDVFTEDKYLIDLKTTTKKWPQSRADSSLQVTVYNELLTRSGTPPDRLSFAVLIHGSDTPQILDTQRTTSDFESLLRRIRMMLKAIKEGVFHPAPMESWICSPKYCGYWYMCPYVPSHKKCKKKMEE
jgi:RecB family exonuclease